MNDRNTKPITEEMTAIANNPSFDWIPAFEVKLAAKKDSKEKTNREIAKANPHYGNPAKNRGGHRTGSPKWLAQKEQSKAAAMELKALRESKTNEEL